MASRAWALSLALGVLLIACVAVPAVAAPRNEANTKRLDSTVRFLESAQNSDGGFSANGNAGEPSDPEFSAWAAIGLASAGINPQNQARPGGESAYSYLADHAGELNSTTDFERALLVVDAAGTSAQDFGGVNLVQAILQRKLPDGGFSHEQGEAAPGVNDTIFAIIALSPIQEPTVQEAVGGAVDWLEKAQNKAQNSNEGSWSLTAGGAGNVDITAAAIEALNAAGVHESAAQVKAFEYLHDAQDPDGGFPEYTSKHESDTASTAWVAQAIWSAGENPETWTQSSSGKEPLDYLESMQRPDGSIEWEAGKDENPVWMTAYAAPAFAGQALPPPAVPLAVPSAAPTSDTGVTAGGGGDGAPLFSRPQPQSVGDTPGGARLLHAPRGHAARKARRHPRDPGPRRADALAIATPDAARSAAPDPQRRKDGTGAPSSSPAVTGLLIDASDDTRSSQAGAPGLRSAATPESPTRWLAIGLGGLIALLILAGSLLERRRPQVIL